MNLNSKKFANTMKDKFVILVFDGWSNVTNEPVLGIMRDNQFIASIDTTGVTTRCYPPPSSTGHPHTWEDIASVMGTALNKARTVGGAVVVAMVTDNTTNMANMRSRILNP